MLEGRGGELARKLRSVHVAQPGLRVPLQLPQGDSNTLPVRLADTLIASDQSLAASFSSPALRSMYMIRVRWPMSESLLLLIVRPKLCLLGRNTFPVQLCEPIPPLLNQLRCLPAASLSTGEHTLHMSSLSRLFIGTGKHGLL